MARPVPTYLLYGEATAAEPDFWVHCETIKSRSQLHKWEIGLHRHEIFFQIFYFQSGSGDVAFYNESHIILPPCVITIPPRVDHGFRFSQDIEGFVVTILDSYLGQVRGDRTGGLGLWMEMPRITELAGSSADTAYIVQTLERFSEEFHGRKDGRNNLLMAYIASTLQLLSRASRHADGPLSMDEKVRRIELFRGMIQQHFRAHKPLTYYADALGVSVTHLNRIVRTTLGCTAHDLLAEKLIDEAKSQLLFSSASVQDVSKRLGFNDPAYFSRFFSSRTGETPRAWRLTEQTRLEKT